MSNLSQTNVSGDESDPLIEALLTTLRNRLYQDKPRDARRFLRTTLDQQIEQEQARSLSVDMTSVLPQLRFKLNNCSQRRKTLFGLDVGGSLCKVAFYEPDESAGVEAEFVKSSERYGSSGIRDSRLSFHWKEGTFHFLNFETRRMEGAISLMKKYKLLREDEVLFATGGGSHKFSSDLSSRLGLSVIKGDELQCLLWGINFLLQHINHECFYLVEPKRPLTSPTVTFETQCGSVFPYLLVNIGSGASILKVDSNDSFQRVSGTIMGGGTFWGLCRMLTNCATFEDAVELATTGNASNVNMLVGDIYGGSYDLFGLSADIVASAFGKVGVMEDVHRQVKDADIARGLLEMVGQNIAQLAYLCARRYHLTRIIFCGNFLRNNRLSMGSIAYAIDYWSHGVQKALFLLHEGYFGAVGAFFQQDEHPWQPDDDLKTASYTSNATSMKMPTLKTQTK